MPENSRKGCIRLALIVLFAFAAWCVLWMAFAYAGGAQVGG